MVDVVVTVPKGLWDEWIAEGDLPGDRESDYAYHFWVSKFRANFKPAINPGERVYIVAHGKLRGYSPLVEVERACRLDATRSCFLRRGNAVAVTLDEPIRGFRGWQYRWWKYEDEKPFPDWMVP